MGCRPSKENRKRSTAIKNLDPQRLVSARNLVEQKLRQRKRLILFSKTDCQRCLRVKRILRQYSIPADLLEFVELDGLGWDYIDATQLYLAKKVGQDEVPYLFLNGEFLGTLDTIVEMDKSGALFALLKNQKIIKVT